MTTQSELILPTFERESLDIKFNPKTERKFYDETKDIQNDIVNAANKNLFHWKKISTVLPSSLTGMCDNINSEYDTGKAHEKISNLFILPSYDELDDLAVDRSGKVKKLNNEQLDEIRKNGEFGVNSINFPGQAHTWRLTNWLQLGYVRSNQILYTHLSNALRLLIVVAKRRINSTNFSIVAGFRSIYRGVYRFADMLIGLPAFYKNGIGETIAEAEAMFLVAELTVDAKEQEKHEEFCKQFKERMIRKRKDDEENFVPFNIPSFYRTPDGLLIDLRLLDENLMKKVTSILDNLLSERFEDKDWFIKRRKELISQFKSENLADEVIVENTKNIIQDEHVERVFERIAQSKELERLSPNLSILLIDHAKYMIIMENSLKLAGKRLEEHVRKYEEELKAKHPVKSKIREWLDDCLRAERKVYDENNLYLAHQLAIEECEKQGLKQAVYFLKRDLIFHKEHEDRVRKETLAKLKKIPSKTFTFYRCIWLPKNYIVTRREENKEPVVVKPVVFENTFLPDTVYNGGESEARYSLDRLKTYTTNTIQPFWRWKTFFMRTAVTFCNLLFYLGIVIPFFSPVSFSVLYKLDYFYPDKCINIKTGRIHINRSSKTLTLATRILAIWTHIAECRQKFEAQPDKGLIGKSIQRVFNCIWNYFFKGIIGTAGLLAIIPTVCLSISTASIALALTIFIWYPILSLFLQLCHGLIFDWDYPYQTRPGNRVMVFPRVIIWDILICSLVQPVAAFLSAFVLCPVTSVLIVIYAYLRKFLRSCWDTMMFFGVLKPRARIPSCNTFVARRIAGPGLASQYLYQITKEQALAALEIHLEIATLVAYLACLEKMIDEPAIICREFFDTIISQFSHNVNTSNYTTYEKLSSENCLFKQRFQKIVSKRLQHLRNGMDKASSTRSIRLVNEDLKIVLQKGTEIVKAQYLKSILPYQEKSVKQLFRDNNMEDDDWLGLTGACLEKIFGQGFLVSLDKSDTFFKLEVDHLNLSKYTRMFENSELRDDLDLVIARFNPKKQDLVISKPSVNRSLFRADVSTPAAERRPTSMISQMNIPTRLPYHIGILSILVFNRHNEEQKIIYKRFDDIKSVIDRDREICLKNKRFTF